MNIKIFSVCLIPILFLGCKDDDASSDPDPGLSIPPLDFGLDEGRLLSSLSDEEIGQACQQMAATMAVGDEGIACRIQAVGESDSKEECVEAHDACIEDPATALASTTFRTTPAPIDCSIFSAELTIGCDHSVKTLQDCADGLANSVVSSAEVVTCDEPDAFSNMEDAESAAREAADFGYISICEPLLECETLVAALLTGMVPDGLGGSGGSQ